MLGKDTLDIAPGVLHQQLVNVNGSCSESKALIKHVFTSSFKRLFTGYVFGVFFNAYIIKLTHFLFNMSAG